VEGRVEGDGGAELLQTPHSSRPDRADRHVERGTDLLVAWFLQRDEQPQERLALLAELGERAPESRVALLAEQGELGRVVGRRLEDVRLVAR
jgi:hypothetical protein